MCAHVFDMNKKDCNTETCFAHQLEPLEKRNFPS